MVREKTHVFTIQADLVVNEFSGTDAVSVAVVCRPFNTCNRGEYKAEIGRGL